MFFNAIIPTILVIAAGAWVLGAARFVVSRHSRQDSVEEDGVEQPKVRMAKSSHAARANKLIPAEDIEVPVVLPDTIFDVYGRVVHADEKYVGVVRGDSCKRFGLPDGAFYLGEQMDSGISLETDDFVVVDGKTVGSNVGRRIRRVAEVAGDLVTFYPDQLGNSHNNRPLSEISVKITHILA